MINKQRVKRIRHAIYTVIVLLLFIPVILLIALSISMIGFLRDAADSLNRIESHIATPVLPSPSPELLEPEDQSADTQFNPGGTQPAVFIGEENGQDEPQGQDGQDIAQGGGTAETEGLNTYRPETLPQLFFDTAVTPSTAGAEDIYLTVDNTPAENFPAIMGLLDKYNIKATFFVWRGDSGGTPMLGSDYRAIIQAGHSIGIHCGDPSIPLSRLYSSAEFFLDDFAMMFDMIEHYTGVRTRLYRLPGGSVNPHHPERDEVKRQIIAELDSRGFIQHDWNASGEDAVIPPLSMQQILSNLHTNIQGGGRIIALVHDGTGSDSTVRALEQFIPFCLEQGYVFRAMDHDTVPVSFLAD
ncbi:MAG: polysaccharide deacetylase family protein [Oscillospiraceae bacterium]|nr:polysaccharide deacetylase family protein [Oscillospiraceae bacterium]